MSKDDSGIEKRSRKTEYSQVVSPNVAPDRRRRNSMPLPLAHGGEVRPMERGYQPPVPQGGQQYWYHVTTPQNFQLIQQSGGLMPLTHQPQRGRGLDEETGRSDTSSWSDQMRQSLQAIENAPLEARLHNLRGDGPRIDAQDLIRPLRANVQRLAREGTNQENLYMSANIGSSLDYMMGSREMQNEGAVLMRVPRRGTGGFRQDTQGKQQDYRSLGMVIQSRHIEFSEIPAERVTDIGGMEERDAHRTLTWQAMNPKKAQPVHFQWTSGACSPEARSRHGFGGPKRGPEGGGSTGGILA